MRFRASRLTFWLRIHSLRFVLHTYKNIRCPHSLTDMSTHVQDPILEGRRPIVPVLLFEAPGFAFVLPHFNQSRSKCRPFEVQMGVQLPQGFEHFLLSLMPVRSNFDFITEDSSEAYFTKLRESATSCKRSASEWGQTSLRLRMIIVCS